MPIRYPIEYELNPENVSPGTRWLTLKLKNVGTEDLVGLDVRLNSLDAYSLNVLGTGSYISLLGPNEERVLPFQVSAVRTASVYVSIDGLKGTNAFHWESPIVFVTVGEEAAELVSLFAMSEPYPPVGERIRIEATIRGRTESGGFSLEFWADTPSGKFEELGIVETKPLEAGEEAVYAAEVTPEEEGLYTIYGYLYDDAKRLGRETEMVYVRET